MLVKRNLLAKLICRLHVIVAGDLALGILGGEDEEFELLEWQAELLEDVLIVLGSLVAGTAGTVEALPRVDAGSGHVAVVVA